MLGETINVSLLQNIILNDKTLDAKEKDLLCNYILLEEKKSISDKVKCLSNKSMFLYKLKDPIQQLSLAGKASSYFLKNCNNMEDSNLYLLTKTLFRSAMNENRNPYISLVLYKLITEILKSIKKPIEDNNKALLCSVNKHFDQFNLNSAKETILNNKEQFCSQFSIIEENSLIEEDENEFFYLVNKFWYDNAKNFIEAVKSGSNEDIESLFEKKSVLQNWYMNNTQNPSIFCGKINNCSLIKFKDYWYDPNEDQSYTNVYLNHSIEERTNYLLLNEKKFEFYKNCFEIEKYQTIKRKKDEIHLVDMKILIFSKMFISNSKENFLKFKHIQISKKTTLEQFKEKVIRCLSHCFSKEDNSFYGNSFNFSLYYSECITKYDTFTLIASYINNQEKREINIAHLNLQNVTDDESFENLIEKLLSKEGKIKILIEINNHIEDNHFLALSNEDNFNCHYCHTQISETKEFKCKNIPSCQIKYCSKKCLKNDMSHRNFHMKEFNKYLILKFNINSLSSLSFESFYSYDSRKGITGLENLGNTCFMNSALQCLANCDLLTLYFLSEQYKQEINTSTKYGSGGQIADAYYDLLKKLWIENRPHVHPINFRQIFVNFVKQFAGFSQQDSHEMLTFMLDGLHEDLNRNYEKKYVELCEQKPEENDLQASERWWKNLLVRDNSIIVDLFYGQYKSTVKCNVCSKISITYDPFMCLGVPIGGKNSKPGYIINIKNNSIKKYQFQYSKGDTVDDVLKNTIEDYENKDIAMIVCDENKQYLRYCSPKDIFGVFFEGEGKNRRIIVYEFEKGETENKSFIFVSPMTNKNEKTIMLFYPRPFLYNPTDLIEKFYNDLNKTYKIYFKNPLDTLDDLDEEKIEEDLKMKDESEEYTPNYIIKFVNNLTGASRGKYPCDQCNSFNCIYCDWKFFPTQTIKEIFDSLKKKRNIYLYLQFPGEMFLTSKPDKEIRLYNDFLDDDIELNFVSNLNSCFENLSRTEKLDQENSWYCSTCKEHRQAYKTLELMKLPKFLIIQLKRFKSVTGLFNNSKNDTLVDFPIDNLNLDKYVVHRQNNQHYLYELFAINQHFGWSIGGHYTAFIKNEGQWYDFDDETVSPINPSKLVSNNAYLLFYKLKE